MVKENMGKIKSTATIAAKKVIFYDQNPHPKHLL
jgi:hypothetical protein